MNRKPDTKEQIATSELEAARISHDESESEISVFEQGEDEGHEAESGEVSEASESESSEDAAGQTVLSADTELAPLRPEMDDDGYLYHYPRRAMPQLPFAAKEIGAAKTETEVLLNGLIDECGSLMRDVAFRSACHTPDASERLKFLTAAESLALTAAKVAETIARLRHGEPPSVETHRHELIYTHVRPSPRPLPAGGDVQ